MNGRLSGLGGGHSIFSTMYVTVLVRKLATHDKQTGQAPQPPHSNKHNICAMSLRVQREGRVAHTSQPVPIIPVHKQKIRVSKIPKSLQFPLVVLLSFTTSSLLSSLVPTLGNESLRRVTKTPNGWELGALLGWRV